LIGTSKRVVDSPDSVPFLQGQPTESLANFFDLCRSFNDPERGIVWEFSLGLLPAHVRLMLLSATVGNAYEFTSWLRRLHRRSLELVQSDERKIPLSYRWVGDQLLSEQLELMAAGSDESRYTPALVFCFNRDECWDVAEMLKGKGLLHEGQQKQLAQQLEQYDWSRGAGPKLKQLLYRGVGVHHAGVLPIRRSLSAQTTFGLYLYGNAGGRDQSTRTQRRLARLDEGAAR
jgi:superfamily II RNA helicase